MDFMSVNIERYDETCAIWSKFQLAMLKRKKKEFIVDRTRLTYSNFIRNWDEMACEKKSKLGNNLYTNQWISCLSMLNGRVRRALCLEKI